MSARVVQKYVLDEVEDPALRVYTVWGPMLGEETAEDATSATVFLHDERSAHFWTPLHGVAELFREPAGLPSDELAWDTFHLFAQEAEWGEQPPAPAYVMHVEKSLPDDRRLNGHKLRQRVEALLTQGVAKAAAD